MKLLLRVTAENLCWNRPNKNTGGGEEVKRVGQEVFSVLGSSLVEKSSPSTCHPPPRSCLGGACCELSVKGGWAGQALAQVVQSRVEG